MCCVPSETFDYLGYTFGRCYTEDGPRLSGHPSFEEEHPPGHREAVRRDGSAHRPARYGPDRAAYQLAVARLGGVLLPGPREQELSGAGPVHDPSAPPVAAPSQRRASGRHRAVQMPLQLEPPLQRGAAAESRLHAERPANGPLEGCDASRGHHSRDSRLARPEGAARCRARRALRCHDRTPEPAGAAQPQALPGRLSLRAHPREFANLKMHFATSSWGGRRTTAADYLCSAIKHAGRGRGELKRHGAPMTSAAFNAYMPFKAFIALMP